MAKCLSRYKGVRQGDPLPLSPLLFNTDVNALAYIIHICQEEGSIKGMAPDLQQNGFVIF